jgi:RNA-splicing ligase RtcB
METNYVHEDVVGGVPLKMWTRGVPVEDAAKRQLTNTARLPIAHHHIAAMPDVHYGIGATVADHRAATEGVECRKDKDVIDETPAAYKDIDAVMAAQADLVDVVHTLKQVVCVKG